MKNKVIIYARSIPAHCSGGLEVVTWDMCKGLAGIGLEVDLITTVIPKNNIVPEVKNINIIQINDTITAKYNNAWWTKSAKHFLSYDPENIVGVISVSAAGFGVLKHRGNFKNVKFIMQAHGTSIDELKTKIKSGSFIKFLKGIKNIYWFFKDSFYYRKFDHIVGIGDSVVKSLTSFPNKFFIKNGKVVKIENGIDESLFAYQMEERVKIRKSLKIDSQRKVVISVCRLHEQKGVDNNIRLVDQIIKKTEFKDLFYIICGSGPEESKLKDLVHSLSLTDNVIFVGDQQRSVIANYLSASDIFLFLTKRIEGLPLNVLEAQSSGLPMIISKHLLFKESDSVKKIDYTDINQASEILCKMLQNNESIDRKGYINESNTLKYSTNLYYELLSRK